MDYQLDGDIATVGITDFAQRELGDIVYVEVESVGEILKMQMKFLEQLKPSKLFQIYFYLLVVK